MASALALVALLVWAPVPALLRSACPSAISLAVWSVGIDAVEGQPIGPNTHIADEVAEISPFRAERDASTSVIFPVWTVIIPAPGEHRVPRDISRTELLSLRVSVKYGVLDSLDVSDASLALETPTTSCVSVSQGTDPYLRKPSAFAFAIPNVSPSGCSVGVRDHGEPTVLVACDVYHGGPIITGED